MAHLRTPREAWIDAAFSALADGGPGAVRVEPLAAALGVTKGGFYGQFAGRGALLDEMLDTWERRVIDDVIGAIETDGGGARAKLGRLFAAGASIASDATTLRVELAIRDWARRDDAVAARLRRVDARRMDYMRPLFRELAADDADAEARCLLAFSLFVGGHFLAVDHGPHRRAAVVDRALHLLLA